MAAFLLVGRGVKHSSKDKSVSNEHLDESSGSSCSSPSKQAGRICNYKDLRVWQDAMDLAEQVYIETKSFPASETFGLRKQIRDAATSIPSNVAEATGVAGTGHSCGSQESLQPRMRNSKLGSSWRDGFDSSTALRVHA